jgi:CBS-domain-containing membrane protein
LIVQQKKLPTPSLFTILEGFIRLPTSKNFEKEFQKIAAITVEKAMSPDPVTVAPDATVEDVATLMVEKKFHTLPVVDETGKLVGIVGKEDVLRTLMEGSGQS